MNSLIYILLFRLMAFHLNFQFFKKLDLYQDFLYLYNFMSVNISLMHLPFP